MKKIIVITVISFAIAILILFYYKQTIIMNNEDQKIFKYGEVVVFQESVNLQYPDFTITFMGKRYKDLSVGSAIRFTYYDFRVLSGGQDYKDINWSSGTGDIGPTIFTINEKRYKLYLKTNDKGDIKLSENEMIISEPDEDTGKSLWKRIFNF